MIAILDSKGTIAISVFKRTIYNCNPFQYGPNMTAIVRIVLDPRDYFFLDGSRETKFSLIAII